MSCNLKIVDNVLISYEGIEKELIVPEGVTEIYTNAISQDFLLTTIKLPESLKKICSNAITLCPSLETIYFPSNVEVIEKFVITDCGQLSNIIFSNKNLKVPDNFIHNQDFKALCMSFYPSQVSSAVANTMIASVLEMMVYSDDEEWKKQWSNYFIIHKTSLYKDIFYDLEYSLGLLSCPLIDKNDLTELINIANINENKHLAKFMTSILNDEFDYSSISEEDLYKRFNDINSINITEDMYGEEVIGDIKWKYKIDLNTNLITITSIEGCAKDIVIPKKLNNLTVSNIDHYLFSPKNYANAPKQNELLNLLESVTFPKEIENFENYCFAYCPNLRKVILPECLTKIPEGTFLECKKLKEIIIPKSVEFIKKDAFSGCESLESITIPYFIKSIDLRAFYKCTSLKEINFEEKEYIDSKYEIKIFNEAFSYCEALESITLPEGLKKLESRLFYGCKSLVEIILPESLNEFSDDIFKKCLRLKNICFKNKNIVITEKIFSKRQLYHIILNLYPSNFSKKTKKIIQSKIFDLLNSDKKLPTEWKNKWMEYYKGKSSHYKELLNDNSLLNFMMNKSLISIRDIKILIDRAQEKSDLELLSQLLNYQNTNFTEEDFNKEAIRLLNIDVTSVSYLKTIWSTKKLPNGTLSIINYKGTNLEVVVPSYIGKNKVTSIGKNAFTPSNGRLTQKRKEFKESITSISIPDGITSINCNAFLGCLSLTELKLPEGISVIESSTLTFTTNYYDKIIGCEYQGFLYKTKVKKLVLPQSVKEIKPWAFNNSEELEEIILPDNLRIIGDSAFSASPHLEEVTIPKSVTDIDHYAFYKCTGLKKVTILTDKIPLLPDRMFYECKKLEEIIIPEGVEALSDFLCEGCVSLKKITLPTSIKKITLNYTLMLCPNIILRIKKGSEAEDLLKRKRTKINYEYY